MVKERTRRTIAYANRESDGVIVPEKPPNNGAPAPAEEAEERTTTEGNAGEDTTPRTQGRVKVSFGLEGVRKRAKADKECRFTALLHHITPELLRESFYKLKRDAKPGIDGVTWWDYQQKLDDRIPVLHEEIHKGSYRATPVLRAYITKDDGTKRPLGMTIVEDKLVEQAVSTILQCIYEADFLGFSYGFRPNRCQHDALDALTTAIYKRRINWIRRRRFEEFLRHNSA